jgi:hypothetical protein
MTAAQLKRLEKLEAWQASHTLEHTSKPLHLHETESPPPDPATRPFPAPVTLRTVNVTTNPQATIDAAGDGVVISFPAGATFTLTKGLRIEGRRDVVLQGNGAILRLNTVGGNSDPAAGASAFMVRNSSHIAIEDFEVIGNNPDTTNIFVPGNEAQHVLSLNGWYSSPPSRYVEIARVTASHIYGDFAYLEGRNAAPFEPSEFVWIHENQGSYIGRNAISSISVNDLLVEGNLFDKIGGAAWDIEPNYAGEQVKRNVFRHNQVGSYGHMRQFVGWFVVAAYVEPTPVSGLTVDDNDVVGNPSAANDGTPRGLNSKFLGEYDNASGARPTSITFTNNRTAQAAEGPVLYCGSGVRATESGNVQPLVSGSFTNCVP